MPIDPSVALVSTPLHDSGMDIAQSENMKMAEAGQEGCRIRGSLVKGPNNGERLARLQEGGPVRVWLAFILIESPAGVIIGAVLLSFEFEFPAAIYTRKASTMVFAKIAAFGKHAQCVGSLGFKT